MVKGFFRGYYDGGMLTGPFRFESPDELPVDTKEQIAEVCREIETAVQKELRRTPAIPACVPILETCDVLFALDPGTLHVVFTCEGTKHFSRVGWLDCSDRVRKRAEIVNLAVSKMRFDERTAEYRTIPINFLTAAATGRQAFVSRFAEKYSTELRLRAFPQPPAGYEHLKDPLLNFFSQYKHFGNNVFIAMRFHESSQFVEVFDAIREALARYGLRALRADMKTYSPGGDLWDNICIYMLGSRYGICVFEELEERHFNPNIPLEYGFMRALNRSVLLLKEKRMPQMPSDITGKLYKPFDGCQITTTIQRQVSSWCAHDLNLKRIAEVHGLRQTSPACPSQWEGTFGQEDEFLYIRFRSGWLTANACQGIPGQHSDRSVREGIKMYEAYLGPDDRAGAIDEEEMKKLLGHIFYFAD